MAGRGAAGTAVPRGHRILPHTADAGIAAEGPTLEAVFEEAAVAVAELSADVDRSVLAPAEEQAEAAGRAIEAGGGAMAGGASTRAPLLRRSVELTAPDLVGLAFAWLNECIGLVDVAGAIVGCRVFAVAEDADGARLRASVDLVPFDGVRVRRRADVKSATYHGLAVERRPGGWSLTAYLDL
ncbi:MAG TPA: archease [Candidatus Binatia bacterium]|nr:archease [Candidatus Binatia bacterium]